MSLGRGALLQKILIDTTFLRTPLPAKRKPLKDKPCYSVSDEDVAELLRNMDDEQFSNDVKQEWSKDTLDSNSDFPDFLISRFVHILLEIVCYYK